MLFSRASIDYQENNMIGVTGEFEGSGPSSFVEEEL
jgi:hypothetical protein